MVNGGDSELQVPRQTDNEGSEGFAGKDLADSLARQGDINEQGESSAEQQHFNETLAAFEQALPDAIERVLPTMQGRTKLAKARQMPLVKERSGVQKLVLRRDPKRGPGVMVSDASEEYTYGTESKDWQYTNHKYVSNSADSWSLRTVTKTGDIITMEETESRPYRPGPEPTQQIDSSTPEGREKIESWLRTSTQQLQDLLSE